MLVACARGPWHTRGLAHPGGLVHPGLVIFILYGYLFSVFFIVCKLHCPDASVGLREARDGLRAWPALGGLLWGSAVRGLPGRVLPPRSRYLCFLPPRLPGNMCPVLFPLHPAPSFQSCPPGVPPSFTVQLTLIPSQLQQLTHVQRDVNVGVRKDEERRVAVVQRGVL